MSYFPPGRALRAALMCAALVAQERMAAGQAAQGKTTKAGAAAAALAETGQTLFLQNCAFCHGRDAGGGETGPDLTGSKLVASDTGGNRIGEVVRNGRIEKGMPRFDLQETDIAAVAAFIHAQKAKADAHPGGRRRVDPEDLQTGNAEAGKTFFFGAGGCSGCHSPEGDLAGVATRYKGLKLEERLLFPEKAPAKLTVTLPSGETITGKLTYRDEFTVGLTDEAGWYRSWAASDVKFKVDAPAEAHAELLAKYTDGDIHNLMAYLQRLHHETASK